MMTMAERNQVRDNLNQVWERGLITQPYGTSPLNREVERFQTLPLSWERELTGPYHFLAFNDKKPEAGSFLSTLLLGVYLFDPEWVRFSGFVPSCHSQSSQPFSPINPFLSQFAAAVVPKIQQESFVDGYTYGGF